MRHVPNRPPRRLLHTLLLAMLCAASSLLIVTSQPKDASAFCGFYVAGADQEMFNNATMVVMMREGTKTVLSMRNNYEGPPEDFAMVIPVPQVLKQEDVKTLQNDLFDKIDRLAAPRLVEYWEQDPCSPRMMYESLGAGGLGMRGVGKGGGGLGSARASVKVEAEFDVDEYNVVILSAKESTGLESWLKENKYNIPEGAAPVLKPYIEQGLYFFVARVDPKKITFNKEGQAQLSPLRFSYESKDFFLPVRLGLLNAKGHQDLIVHILAKEARYEVANYKNVSIPTNLVVKSEVRDRFANFYVSLFDRVLEENPGAVVTEYAWNSGSCDPCPGPTLNQSDLVKLGLNYLEGKDEPEGDDNALIRSGRGGSSLGFGNPWVLTRMHARYTEKELNEDLIFKKAEAIVGGRGTPHGLSVIEEGVLGEQRAIPSSINNFQGRYIMLNPWEGAIECEDPNRGVWRGNRRGTDSANKKTRGVAQNTAFVEREPDLLNKMLITRDVPTLKNVDAPDEQTSPPATDEASKPSATPAVDDQELDSNPPKQPVSQSKPGCGVTPLQADRQAPSRGLLGAWLCAMLGGLWLRRRRG